MQIQQAKVSAILPPPPLILTWKTLFPPPTGLILDKYLKLESINIRKNKAYIPYLLLCTPFFSQDWSSHPAVEKVKGLQQSLSGAFKGLRDNRGGSQQQKVRY